MEYLGSLLPKLLAILAEYHNSLHRQKINKNLRFYLISITVSREAASFR